MPQLIDSSENSGSTYVFCCASTVTIDRLWCPDRRQKTQILHAPSDCSQTTVLSCLEPREAGFKWRTAYIGRRIRPRQVYADETVELSGMTAREKKMKAGARANSEVLITGAGVAGQALAFWLQRYGFKPTMIEHAPRFRNGGYMIDVWGTGYNALERFDLLNDALELSYPIDCLIFVDDRGREIATFGNDLIHRIFGDRFFCIQRGDLARVFHNALGTQVEVLYSTSIDLLCDTEEGIYVSLSGSRFRKYDLVIGADGQHSRIRELVFGPEQEFEKHLRYYAASFITANYPHRNETAYVSHACPGRQISRYALRDGRSAFLLVFAEPHQLDIDRHCTVSQKNTLRSRFGNDAWETDMILSRMDAAEEFFFDSVGQIRMPNWSRGRVALVGDAAYCPSLLAGEGAAFAMLGAYVLAGELHRSDGDHQRAFAAYEARLRNFIRAKQDAALGFARSFAPRTEMGLCVRNSFLKLLNVPAIGAGLSRRMFGSAFELPEYTEVTSA